VGLMGSAVAASHLLRLDPGQLANALGIAGSRCSGLPANTGSMVKCTHCGNAAAAGLEAGLLAARGFTAHPNILEAPHGYVSTFFKDRFDYDALFRFGQPFRCVDPGMAIKFNPSKYPTHFAITAALEVRPEIGDPTAVRHIRIVTPEIVDANRPQPRVGLEGKFSFQYTVAAALLDGKIGIDSFTDEKRFRPEMVALLNRTEVVYDKNIPKDTRKMQVEVEVTLPDGAKRSRICRKPPGTWGIPVDQEQHRAKIRDCLGARLAEPRLGETLDLLDRLERLSARETARLLALLG
jgi:2-methylcitrate dehydratase PrpD